MSDQTPTARPDPRPLADQLRKRSRALWGMLPDCTTPAYGAPGHAHCAACCYGTLKDATTPEEQEVWLAARDTEEAASTLYALVARCDALEAERQQLRTLLAEANGCINDAFAARDFGVLLFRWLGDTKQDAVLAALGSGSEPEAIDG